MSAIPQPDVAYRVLRLEQQLDSYQRLHTEELEEIRHALAELKDMVLGSVASKSAPSAETTKEG